MTSHPIEVIFRTLTNVVEQYMEPPEPINENCSYAPSRSSSAYFSYTFINE